MSSLTRIMRAMLDVISVSSIIPRTKNQVNGSLLMLVEIIRFLGIGLTFIAIAIVLIVNRKRPP